jgi:hypothetical protein
LCYLRDNSILILHFHRSSKGVHMSSATRNDDKQFFRSLGYFLLTAVAVGLLWGVLAPFTDEDRYQAVRDYCYIDSTPQTICTQEGEISVANGAEASYNSQRTSWSMLVGMAVGGGLWIHAAVQERTTGRRLIDIPPGHPEAA